MLNISSKLVTAFISPLGIALALGIFALLLGPTRHRRLAWGVSAFGLFWLTLWSTPAASIWLRRIVEGEPLDALVEELSSAGAIVVLGGGMGPPQTPQARPNLGAAIDRVWYGASLYHAGKAPLIVVSGGSDAQTTVMTEAESMLWLLQDFGVPSSAVLMEARSRNTVQNAKYTAEILKERGIDDILLVTSALHMPRALPRFEAEGLTVTPAPTDYEAQASEAWRSWIPDTGALDGSARAMKEIVGRLVNR